MAPWNGAGVLAARAIAYPIVCGNSVVFRASGTSPKTHAIIVEAMHEAGCRPGAQLPHQHCRGLRRIVERSSLTRRSAG
jgi:acyl-CoA reductase-like NAD-dependent aldehyde dehydrogenase